MHVTTENPDLCPRYIACVLHGVTVGPSPEWLVTRLASMGQRSINNVVDATNFVMFNLGQPLHAFDAGRLGMDGGAYSIVVRSARAGERIDALDGREYTLAESNLVITDGTSDTPIGIAGVKGGTPASITTETKDIILESANFNSVSVRKTAQILKLRTDASSRFEQGLSPELALDGMQAVVSLIQALAGGELAGYADVYPKPQKIVPVEVSVGQIARTLGVHITETQVRDVFTRLGFVYKQSGDIFIVTPPAARLDITIPEDLIEEVGRILGYDVVEAHILPPFTGKVEINQNFAAAEAAREELVAQGYSEVFTSVFAEAGERVVLNKVDGVRPYLRTTLEGGLREALAKNIPNKDLLGIKAIKLFEIGTVWRGGQEKIVLGTIIEEKNGAVFAEHELVPAHAEEYPVYPLSETERYQTFSKYPYIVRDVAFWVPEGIDLQSFPGYFDDTIDPALAGSNLTTSINFLDQFEKSGRTSLAYRLIFQSPSRTLTDDEVNILMERIYQALRAQGFEIR